MRNHATLDNTITAHFTHNDSHPSIQQLGQNDLLKGLEARYCINICSR